MNKERDFPEVNNSILMRKIRYTKPTEQGAMDRLKLPRHQREQICEDGEVSNMDALLGEVTLLKDEVHN